MSLRPTPVSLTPTQGATALRAAQAYANTDNGQPGGFGEALQQALGSVAKAGQEADALASAALTGGGNLTEVVTAIAKAELALQTTMAVRDRVVQAYQDIMRMPI